MRPELLEALKTTLFQLAIESEKFGNARVVAALVNKNEILVASNSSKTHPFQKKFAKNDHSIQLHAETHVIIKALKNRWTLDDIKRSSLIVVRVRQVKQAGDFEFGLAKPCPGCSKCLLDYEVSKIYYSTDMQTMERLQ